MTGAATMSATLSVRVARKAVEATDICTFELLQTNGAALPAFSAGSHIDVHLPNGITRQYSLCNDPAESHRYVVGVLRDPKSRGGSQAMHDLVHEGATLQISAACCWPVASGSRPFCAWPSDWPWPVPRSKCTTAAAPKTAPRL